MHQHICTFLLPFDLGVVANSIITEANYDEVLYPLDIWRGVAACLSHPPQPILPEVFSRFHEDYPSAASCSYDNIEDEYLAMAIEQLAGYLAPLVENVVYNHGLVRVYTYYGYHITLFIDV